MLERYSERVRQQILCAREEERKWIARELHDQIVQSLVGINYHLSNIRTHIAPDVDGQMAQLQEEIRQVLSDARNVCADLRVSMLDDLGLAAAIRSWACALERRGSFEIVLRIEGQEERQVPEDVALCVFRIVQEALANVQKHAAARQVIVSLLIGPDALSLTVQDDGVGFHVPARLSRLADDRHFGLIGMQERLDLVHGALEIRSTPGQGTSIHVQIPYRRLAYRQAGSSEVNYE